MKKAFKLLAMGLATISCCCAVACDNNSLSSEKEQEILIDTDAVATGEILLSGMNTYSDLTNFFLWSPTNISVNHDEEYIKGGSGSAKIYYKDIVGYASSWFFMSPNMEQFKTSTMEEVAFWIYNDTEKEAELLFAGYDPSYRVLFSRKTILGEKAWTYVSIPIDSYQMQLMNPTLSFFNLVFDLKGESEATFYMDSFKVKTTEETMQKTKISFESGELLNFSAIDDLLWATPARRNSYSETITIPTYEYSVVAPFSENGGALKLGVTRLEQVRTSTIIWNGSSQLTELTGFKVPTQLLNQVDLIGTTKLCVDVYHDYTQPRQMTLTITDEVGTSATVSMWVNPYEWTTLSIEDFGNLNFSRIVAVEFFYAEYMTFSDYNIYVDNLRYEKGA